MAGRKPSAFADTFNDEDLDESLLDSPARLPPKPNRQQSGKTAQAPRPSYEDQQTRDQSLRQELASVRKVNETIEGVIQSLDKAKTNMKVGLLAAWV